jgi:hypothetical protein
MAANHDRAEAVPLPEIRVPAPHCLELLMLAGGIGKQTHQCSSVDLSAVEAVQSRHCRRRCRRSVLQQYEYDGCEFRFGQQFHRQRLELGGRRRPDEDHRIESRGGELGIQRGILAQTMFDDNRVRPLDLDANSWPLKSLQDSNRLESASSAVATLLFGFVGSLSLQPLQIFGRHVAGNVLAREARRIEVRDLRVVVTNGVF